MSTKGAFWPSRTQELLLATALAERDSGLAAWHELQGGFELTRLEVGTIGVLPLVYRRIAESLAEDPLLPRLKGIYRSSWVKNNLLVERLRETLTEFERAGVDPVMIGSLAAAVRFYPELALRPTAALDFLIAPGSLPSAVRALGRLGFSAPEARQLDRVRELTMSDANGQACVLRTAPPLELASEDELVRAAAVQVEIGGSTVRALAADEELLFDVVLGARTKPVRSIQWLVDVTQIVRTAQLDWERIISRAVAHGQTIRVQQTLTYLSRVLGLAVPAEAGDRLSRRRVPTRERLAYACSGASVGPLGTLPHALGDHLAATRRRSALGAAATFPAFLRSRWQIEHGWQLPLAGSRRAYDVLTPEAPSVSASQIALTFDDGPSQWTGPILDVLAEHGVRGTFFLVGSVAEQRPDLVRRIRSDGHEIGNHSWSHPALARDCDDQQVRSELERTSDALERLTGERPNLFRAPQYDHDERVDRIAAQLGLRHARGDVLPPDWHPSARAAVIATFVLRGIAPGTIVGLHDGVPPHEITSTVTRQPTVDAVGTILPALAERDVACVPVSGILDR